MTCETCGSPTGWVEGAELERANESKRAAMADARKWHARFEWLSAQHWVEPEAAFRLNLPETEFLDAYMAALIAAIDAKLAPNV